MGKATFIAVLTQPIVAIGSQPIGVTNASRTMTGARHLESQCCRTCRRNIDDLEKGRLLGIVHERLEGEYSIVI